MCICICACVCVCVSITHTRTHVHTHTDTHTHLRICMYAASNPTVEFDQYCSGRRKKTFPWHLPATVALCLPPWTVAQRHRLYHHILMVQSVSWCAKTLKCQDCVISPHKPDTLCLCLAWLGAGTVDESVCVGSLGGNRECWMRIASSSWLIWPISAW
jgi:hypothetical protein